MLKPVVAAMDKECGSSEPKPVIVVIDKECGSPKQTPGSDLELKLELERLGIRQGDDGLIGWRPDSKDHPRNWTAARKAYDTSVIIFLEFFV